MKTRVLILITDLHPGGAPYVVRDLAIGLDSQRFEVQVACLAGEGAVAGQLRQKGIVTHCLGARGAWDLRVFYRLARIIRQFQPQILQCCLIHANVVGRLVGSLTGVPIIVASIHTAERGRRWHLLLERLTSHLSALTICVSVSVKKFMQVRASLPESRLAVIHNGIDFQRFSQAVPVDLAEQELDPAKKTVVFVGRLDPVKSIDMLLNAVGRLREKLDLQLIIVGDGPEKKKLTELAQKLQVTDIVRFTGLRFDAERFIAAADVLVMPSQWEGLPLTALEAMAAGVPVVASRTEGLIDVIRHEKNGLLFKTGDIQQLAEAVERILTDSELAFSLGKNGQKIAFEDFSLKNMISGYEKIYENLLL